MDKYLDRKQNTLNELEESNGRYFLTQYSYDPITKTKDEGRRTEITIEDIDKAISMHQGALNDWKELKKDIEALKK